MKAKTKNLKPIEEINLPEDIVLRDGLFKLNNSQLKVELRLSIRNEEELTPKVIIDAVVKSSYRLRVDKKRKICTKCKGNIFERIEEDKAGGIIFTKWQCLNCGGKSKSTRFDRTGEEEE